MKIAILEPQLHIECLDSLGYLFSQLPYEVHVYTTTPLATQLAARYSRMVWHAAETFSLQAWLPEINTADIVFIETLQTDLSAFAQAQFVPPVILRIHNVNTWLFPWRVAWRNPVILLKNWLRDIVLSKEFYWRSQFMKKNPYLNFCDEPIHFQVVQDAPRFSERTIFLPAGVLFEDMPRQHTAGTVFHLVIPGGVEPLRRDYDTVVLALEKAVALGFKAHVTLLGKADTPYAQNIVRRLESLQPALTVTAFATEVDQAQFQKILCSAQLMLAPLRVATTYSCFTETYGLTKSSGALNDLVRYSIPAIFPQAYRVPGFLQPFVRQYDSVDSLTAILLAAPQESAAVCADLEIALKRYNQQVLVKVQSELQRISTHA